MRIRDRVHAQNPYVGAEICGEADMQGWGGDHPIFRSLISEIRPNRIVEVGTWKGQSAITMAKAVIALELDCEVVCVDTWLGAPEFWTDHTDKNRYLSLKLKHGFPQVYYTFLTNVMREYVQEYITPFPVPSSIASTLFRTWKEKADIVYIDASHEEKDVLSDCLNWAGIANRMLFGHDAHMEGVRNGVNKFRAACAREHTFSIEHDWWIIRFKD